MVIGNSLYSVGQQLYLIALFGDVPADEKVVRRLILDRLVSAKGSQAGPRGNDGLAKSKLHPVKLAGHDDPWEKIADQANRLKMLRKILIFSGNIERSDTTDLRIAQGCDYSAKIVRFDAHVAVVNHQNFVAGFAHHAHELADLVVDGIAARAEENADLAFGKVTLELFEDRHGGIVFIANAKNQLIFRIILAAVARQIFIGFGIQTAQGLQVADRRREGGIRRNAILCMPEKPPSTEENQQVIDERRCCEHKKEITGGLRKHCTSGTG